VSLDHTALHLPYRPHIRCLALTIQAAGASKEDCLSATHDLTINQATTIKELLLINSTPLLDELFANAATWSR
jgi:hypothetical protein